jgi:Ca2+/H+ antiporter
VPLDGQGAVKLAAMTIAVALPALMLRSGRTTRVGGAVLLVSYALLVGAFCFAGDR